MIFCRIASRARAVQIAAFTALPAAGDAEKRLGLLDRLRAVVLLRGTSRRQIERRTVDLVVRRRKAEIRSRRFVVNDGIGIRRIVDDVVVRIIRAVGIRAVDLERIVHALVRRIGSISGIGARIGRRRRIRAVARKKTRVLVALRAFAESHKLLACPLRAADQHLRAGVVRLFARSRDLRVDLAPLDVARSRQRLARRACERIEGVVVRGVTRERRRIGDLARVRRRCARVDRRRRLVERRRRRQFVLIRLNKVQDGKVRLIRRLRAVVNLADVRTMCEIRLQHALFDVALRIAVVGAVGEHLVAVGVRRIEVAGELEVVLRGVRELEVEQHLLVLPHILVVRRISGIAVRRRIDLIDIDVKETVVAAICNIAVRDIAFPSRGIFRITVDICRAVVRLLDRLRAEVQLEVRLRDLERRDLAVAEHRIARRIVARERLAIGISEIVVRCIRARELDTAVFDVVLLRFGSLRRVLRFVDTRICIVEVDRIERATVIGLLRAIVRRQADARRGVYTSYLDDIRIVKRLRDVRGSRQIDGALFNRVRRRRDHIVARSGGNSRPCPAIIKRIVIRNRCTRIDREFIVNDLIARTCRLITIGSLRGITLLVRFDQACILDDRAVFELVTKGHEILAREHVVARTEHIGLAVVDLRYIAVRQCVDGSLRDRAVRHRARERAVRRVEGIACRKVREVIVLQKATFRAVALLEGNRIGDASRTCVCCHIRIGIYRTIKRVVAVLGIGLLPDRAAEVHRQTGDIVFRFAAGFLDSCRAVIDLRRSADIEIEIARLNLALVYPPRTHFDILDRIVAI